MAGQAATASALAKAGRQLKDAASAHKRSAAAHRRRARECMQALEQLERLCRELGIELVIEDDIAKEAQSNAH